MLVTAARASPHAWPSVRSPRSLPSCRWLSQTSPVALESSRDRQCRGIRSGHSSYGEPDEHSGGRRRHARYRYMESLGSWCHGARSDQKQLRLAMKEAMAHVTRPSLSSDSGNSYTNVDDIKSWSDDFSGARPGQNIEDAEREAIDHLLRAGKASPYEYDLLKSPIQNIRNYFAAHRAPRDVSPQEVLDATTAHEQDSVIIDPITNRRVSQSSPGTITFIPKYEDLDEYWSAKAEKSAKTHKLVDTSARVAPNSSEQPASFVSEAPQDKEGKNNGLDDHPTADTHCTSTGNIQKPVTKKPSMTDVESRDYSFSTAERGHWPQKPPREEDFVPHDELGKYKTFKWNEPDGLRNPEPEELSRSYNDLDKYRSGVGWNEPDGPPKLTQEELSKTYEDLGDYRPFMANEPDGLRRLTPEEKSKQYTDLSKYKDPFVVKEAILQAHEVGQMDTTPKAEPLPPKVAVTTEDSAKEYDDLHLYGPVLWNEPDGLRKLTTEELSKNYGDLHLYRAVQWNEPHGFRELSSEEMSKHYQDLDQYAPRGQIGHDLGFAKKRLKEASKKDEDVFKCSSSDAGHTSSRLYPEEASKGYNDLHKYDESTAGQYADSTMPSKADLLTCADSQSSLASRRFSGETNNDHRGYRDLNGSSSCGVRGTLYASGLQGGHGSQSSFNHNGSGSASGSDDGQSGSGSGAQPIISAATPRPSETHRNKFSSDFTETSIDFVDSETEKGIRAEVLRKAWENSQGHEQTYSKERSGALWDAAAEEAKGTLHLSKPELPKPLTRNFGADFPEEFEKSWDWLYTPGSSSEYRGQGNREIESRVQNDERQSAEWFSASDAAFHPQYQARSDQEIASHLETAERQVEKWNYTPADSSAQAPREREIDRAISWRMGTSGGGVSDAKPGFTEPAMHPQFQARSDEDIASHLENAEREAEKWTYTPPEPRSNRENLERDEVEMSSMDESFPRDESSKLEPALNRQHVKSQISADRTDWAGWSSDPHSKTALDTKTSSTKSAVDNYPESTPIQDQMQTSDVEPATKQKVNTATVYKILAYDPATMSVQFSSTTSTVDEAWTPLTPADALVRLNNPLKFLPHLPALQSQGYEIASGGGDILVFRQMSAQPREAAARVRTRRVNPVDMMGKAPVSGNFASPTGFVNYDTIADDDIEKPVPPFRSNIDVRKEEPVFSGYRKANSGSSGRSGSRKRSLGRKLVVGAAWIAGTAYAVGVLGEYFSTGGLDGLGPRGL